MAGGDLTLSWNDSCTATDDEYELYEGSIGDYTSHAPKLCTTSGATTVTITPSAGASYYLVVPANPFREGSYGRNSSDVERPVGSSTCLVQLVASCPPAGP